MIRRLKNFKRAITGNANVTTIESALIVCILAFAALGSAQLLFRALSAEVETGAATESTVKQKT